jgi:hypothetical protein
VCKFDPPYRRFAIRLTKKGEVFWWTDDGTGCDDAQDYTDWDPKQLVTYVHRDEAVQRVSSLREFARDRGLSLCVVPVWEYPEGRYELKKHKDTVFATAVPRRCSGALRGRSGG